MLNLLVVFSVGSQSSEYTIEGETVYIDDANVRIVCWPHTIKASEWVYLNLTSKRYTGEINFLFGFDQPIVKPKHGGFYAPHYESYNLSEYWDNPEYLIEYNYTERDPTLLYNGTFQIYRNETLFHNNASYSWRWTLVYNSWFDYANTQTKTVYLWELWKPIKDKLEVNLIKHNFRGFNFWYYGSANVTANQTYTLRFWLDLREDVTRVKGKYFVGFKPSSETFQEAISRGHFYFIDPWFDDSELIDDCYRVNNMGSIALRDEHPADVNTLVSAGGFTFNLINNYSLYYVQFYLYKTGVPTANLSCGLFNCTTAGLPDQIWPNVYSDNLISSTSLGTSEAWFTFNFSGSYYNLTAGVNYSLCVIANSTEVSTVAFPRLRTDISKRNGEYQTEWFMYRDYGASSYWGVIANPYLFRLYGVEIVEPTEETGPFWFIMLVLACVGLLFVWALKR